MNNSAPRDNYFGLPSWHSFLSDSFLNDACWQDLNDEDNVFQNNKILMNRFQKPLADWTCEEVVEFIRGELLVNCYNYTDESFEKFHSTSGYIFKYLTRNQCVALCNSEELGEIIFKAKELYVSNEQKSTNMEIQLEVTCGENQLMPLNESGEPKNTEPVSDDALHRKNMGRPRRNTARRRGRRSEKLWEFIINLLKNRDTCPELIKWIDHEEGTFQFVQSEKIAKMWGARKDNKAMNYEKFSRAMRYYYKSNIIQGSKKRLVYKFGPQAKGWKMDSQ